MRENEVKLFLSVDGGQAVANEFQKVTGSLQKFKKETPITETYELSKAFKQLGMSMGSMGSLPIIGDLASTGSTIAHTAGGLKNLMSGIKTLGSVSVGALGAAGTAGLIAGVGAAAYLAGEKIDELFYKFTGRDLSGFNKIKDLWKDIAQETEFLNSKLENTNKKLAMLGMAGADAKERMKGFNEAVKAGAVVYDQASGKWLTSAQNQEKLFQEHEKSWKEMTEAGEKYRKEQKELNDATENWKFKIEGLNPALSDLDKQIASLNREAAQLREKFGDKGWISEGLKQGIEFYKEQDALNKWVASLKSAVEKEKESIKQRIDYLSSWRDKVAQYYDAAIAKAEEYYNKARSLDDSISKSKEFLAGYNAPQLAPAEQMERERDSLKGVISSAWISEDPTFITNTLSKLEGFLTKYKDQKDFLGFSLDFSGLVKEYENLTGKLERMREGIDRQSVSYQKLASTAAEKIREIDNWVLTLQANLKDLEKPIDVKADTTEAMTNLSTVLSTLQNLTGQTWVIPVKYGFDKPENPPPPPGQGNYRPELPFPGSSPATLPSTSQPSAFQDYGGGVYHYGPEVKYDFQDYGNVKVYDIYDKGTDYVPRTGPYILHQGEQVIPADKKNNGSQISITLSPTIVINGASGNVAQLAADIDRHLAELIKYNRSALKEALNEA
ncbi:MAG: hypothetical protein FD156_190 [Nitrospirae bacterium]|nr:MAG: hypothetical protein FD156_190 [Nitrospirota bacterium]